MAGLLDFMNDPETMGLLSASAGMFNASGPSSQRRSLGQVLGAGLQGGMAGVQNVTNNRMKMEELEQEKLLRQIQMQQAQMGLQKGNMEMDQYRMSKERDARIRARMMPGATPQPTIEQPDMSAPFAPGGDMSPKVGGPDWMQGQERPQPAPMQAQAPQAQSMSTQPSATRALYEKTIATAKIHEEEGDFATAEKLYERAGKFMPKVDKWQEMNIGGKIQMLPLFADGTPGQPVAYDVAEKLHFANLGGKTVGVNAYTGQQVAGYQNTQTPDSVANNAVQRRGQDMVDARSRQAASVAQANHAAVMNAPEYKQDADGNWLALPKKVAPGAQITAMPVFGADGRPLAAAQKPLTEAQGKAMSFASRMSNANKIINDLDAAGTKTPSAIKTIIDGPYIPAAAGVIGNWAASPQEQKFSQAERDWINANLRMESGAAIGKEEFQSGRLQYFRQPGESDDVARQKAQNRKLAESGMRVQAGPGAKRIDDIISNSAPAAPVAATPPRDAINMLKMKPSLRAAFDQKYGAGAADAALGR